jgi:two-component system, sensor histidine kinase
VQLLAAGTPEQAAIFADLNQSLSRFEIIFGELVDFSELEAKSSRVVCVSTSIPRLVNSLVARFENPAKERGMQIEADCSGLGQDVFLLDPFHTRSILGELIRNAIKHAAGCIRIRAVTTGGRLRFEVEDQGAGVGSNTQTHLFASVGQGDGTLTRERGGIGLGLARCRRRVDLLGGSMGFEPRGEQPGSRFWFEIPCSAATEAELAAEPMTSANRVALVVEDDPISARIISRMIERSGWTVLNAENGQRSLELLATEDVGIVFMDCQMPVMDGLTATRAIRESPARVSRLPVYAVTAHGLPAERAACLDAGMNDVLDKPVQRAVIEAVLKAHSVA